jgi:hypothetical protein
MSGYMPGGDYRDDTGGLNADIRRILADLPKHCKANRKPRCDEALFYMDYQANATTELTGIQDCQGCL